MLRVPGKDELEESEKEEGTSDGQESQTEIPEGNSWFNCQRTAPWARELKHVGSSMGRLHPHVPANRAEGRTQATFAKGPDEYLRRRQEVLKRFPI